MGSPEINGFGHIDLTVTDVERSRRWWEEVMGFQLVDIRTSPDRTSRAMMNAAGLAVILVAHSQQASDRFDERAVGLDHLALRVPDRDTLNAWAAHLDELGVPNSGVQEENGGPLIVFRDPDNIQLEVWAFDPSLATMNAVDRND